MNRMDAPDTTSYLSWRDRPEDVKTRILECFNKLSKNQTSNWGVYNGQSDEYQLAYLKEYEV